MSKKLFGILAILSFIFCIAIALIMASGAFTGDKADYYHYTGQAILDDSCNDLSIIMSNFKQSDIVSGVTVSDVCDKDLAKVNIASYKNVDLGIDWITQTTIYTWTLPMFIILIASCIGCFVACMIFLYKTL